jgi:hypothetical protein
VLPPRCGVDALLACGVGRARLRDECNARNARGDGWLLAIKAKNASHLQSDAGAMAPL